MREIKYKAWDVDGQFMLYSDFNAMGFYTKENPDDIAENTETVFMYHDYTGEKDYVLLQYTGMKDRDGIEIYEGDIVEIPVKYGKGIGKVIFDEGCFKAFWDSSTHYPTKGKITGRYYLNSKAKVIGNIYENLELLKI